MRTLKTSEAATLLRVSPNTLRGWERRFGYPRPRRSTGRHRVYTHGEIAALGNALRDGLSIQSAISRVRESLSGDTDSLIAALVMLDGDAADLAMESAVALRTFDRCVEDVLLRSLDELAVQIGEESATWAHAACWADGWLRRAQRLAPPPHGRLTVLVGDADCGEVDGDLLARRSLRMRSSSPAAGRRTSAPDRTGAPGVGAPGAIRGRAAAARAVSLPGLAPDVRAAGAWVLPDAPHEAHRELLGRIEQLHAALAVEAARGGATPARILTVQARTSV